LAAAGRRAVPRDHSSIVVLARVLGKQRHLRREGEVCVETIVVGDVLQDSVKIVRTGRGCRTRKEIYRTETVLVRNAVL
jgi:hypothetical protein